MGSKTRLGSYCTKRANNGLNLVTSRKINTRLARPIMGYSFVRSHLREAECQTPTLKPECQKDRQFVPFYDGLWYDPAGTRTRGLPHERRTLLPLNLATYNHGTQC